MEAINGCNWIRFLDDGKSIKEINIPGTHDSGTQYVSKDVTHLRCQSLSIKQQLEIGIRYLDIRSYITGGISAPQIRHSSALCLKSEDDKIEANCLTLFDVIHVVETFLLDHKSETVFLQVKNENGDDKLLLDQIGNYLKSHEKQNLFWTDDRIPTLSEVRGKIVLIRRFTYSKNIYEIAEKKFGIDLSSWDTQCTLKSFCNVYVKVNDKAYIQDRYQIGGGKKYQLVTSGITEANDSSNAAYGWWVVNLTSCVRLNPISAATAINQRLMDEPLIYKGIKLGTFVMDFVEEALVRKVYLTNVFKEACPER